MVNETAPQVGDQVSWNWGAGHPAGTIAETTESGSLSTETARGNIVSKKADPENPAVRVERTGGNYVLKRASELTVDQKAASSKNTEGEIGASRSDQDKTGAANDNKGKAVVASGKKGKDKGKQQQQQDEPASPDAADQGNTTPS